MHKMLLATCQETQVRRHRLLLSKADRCMCYRYMVGQHTPGWKWLSFFAIQGPLIAAERMGHKALQWRNMQVPAWLAVPCTLTVLMLTAHMFFFSVWYGTAFADKVDSAIQGDLRSVSSML